MAFSKSEDFYRECREFANPCAARKGRCDAKKPRKIRKIRPHLYLAQALVFALLAFHIGQLVKRLCYCHMDGARQRLRIDSAVPPSRRIALESASCARFSWSTDNSFSTSRIALP
jgi:hypothetical protein